MDRYTLYYENFLFQKMINGGNLPGITRRKIVGNSEDIAKCRV